MIHRPPSLPQAAEPKDALHLLRDERLVQWASNAWDNPHWHHARVTTAGVDDRTLLEAFPKKGSSAEWALRVTNLLNLRLDTMKRDAPALKLVKVPKKEAWDPQYDPEVKRDVFIPCALRRTVSNHLADILAVTSRGVVSEAARAYVPGLKDPVAQVTYEAAKEFAKGRHYHIKLDISDCFNTLRWGAIRKSLLATGYPEHFVGTVMTLLAVPAQRGRGRKKRLLKRDRGAPAGLPESGIILNILLADIDNEILATCKVLFRRYSDDLIIIGDRTEVIRAARLFCGWAWRHGLAIKDLKKKSDPARLVKDVRKQPLEALGVLIDQHGDRHIPQAKVEAHQAKLSYIGGIASDAPESVVGVSRYATTPRPTKGLLVADQDDLERMIWATHRHWSRFNQAEADRLLEDDLRCIRNFSKRPSDGPYRHIFTASLGGTFPSSPWAGSRGASIHSSLTHWVDHFAIPLIGACLDVSKAEGDVRSSDVYTGEDSAMNGLLEELERDFSLCSSGRSFHEEQSSMVVPSLYDNGFDRVASPDLVEVDAGDFAIADRGRSPALDRERPWHPAKVRVCFIATRRLSRGNVAVGVQEFTKGGLDLGPCTHRPFVRVMEDTEPTIAQLTMVLDRIRSPVKGEEALVIAGSSELPKLLLDERRAIRRVGMAHLVSDIHRTDVPTFVLGPVRIPEPLRAELGRHTRYDFPSSALRERPLGSRVPKGAVQNGDPSTLG